MTESPQRKAVKKYRKRLADRGLARYEVLGLSEDRDLIRALAKRLADEDAEASEIRSVIRNRIAPQQPSSKGGIWRALRNSPLVGADLDLTRPRVPGRKVDL